MNLVIVESPAKGKTIEKYLGSDYKVLASYGHVRDLPKGNLGVDTEHNYEPSYVIPTKAKKVINQLKKVAAGSKSVLLATDLDREGEAIAWHIIAALALTGKDHLVERITFNEITKEAITQALKHPRPINIDLVDAQQARRILDRLVGYKLSPFLWKKVYKGLSAGRVQSVAVRLIVDREREIQAFKPVEYWSLEADFKAKKQLFTALLVQVDDKKIDKLTLKTKAEADELTADLENSSYKVVDVKGKSLNRNPYAPFTTSTLQQTASHQLGFSAKRTMVLAQRLYEAGYITYMRTDSVNLSTSSVTEARTYITKQFGKDYLPAKANFYKTRAKNAQEAHEAIRPTHPKVSASDIEGALETDQLALYDLIWRRTLASQMSAAKIEQTTLDIATKSQKKTYIFRSTGSRIVFDGWLRVWTEKREDKSLPSCKVGDLAELIKLRGEQHFTQPPARFNEASLIKTLEEYGIGRPSTYAPTISTIVERGYIRIENRQLVPQEVGFIVTDILKEHFPDIVDVGFTAQLEGDLDEIAEGKKEWVKTIDDFYKPFAKHLLEKEQTVAKQQTEKPSDEICDKCGKPMVEKLGRYGRFLACTGFPDCKNTKPILEGTGLKCPKCASGDVVVRTTRRRKRFWGCSRYPKCDYATWDDPTKQAKL